MAEKGVDICFFVNSGADAPGRQIPPFMLKIAIEQGE
jgi:hypothetical protein